MVLIDRGPGEGGLSGLEQGAGELQRRSRALWEFLQHVLALLLTALLLLLVLSSPDMFDKTRSGRIDVYGFSALLRFIQQWKNLFQQYDRDQSGSISFSELQQGGRGAETPTWPLPSCPATAVWLCWVFVSSPGW